MNNVIISQDETRLRVFQPHALSYKLIIIAFLLLFGATVPAFSLYVFGTNATLTCAREPAAGIVCTDRTDWLGSFPRTWRYERVERAEVLIVDRYRQTTSNLRLITAAGPVVFSDDHHSAYASAAPLINNFIADPSARPLGLSAGIDWESVAINGAILLVVLYFCLTMLVKTGNITLFDAARGRIYLRREGIVRSKVSVLRIDEVISVYATQESAPFVWLRTRDAKYPICWFSTANSSYPNAAARELAEMIIGWLTLYQQQATAIS